MHPYIDILGRQYPTYALCALLGLCTGTFVAGFRAKRYGLTRIDLLYIVTYAAIGLVVGGTLLYSITRIPDMWRNRAMITTDFLGFVVKYNGGLVFYGGLFGVVAAIFLYTRYMRMSFGTVMKVAVPVIPLMHSIMRIGCFNAGCCYGIEYPPPLGIEFTQSLAAPNFVYLLPVQLYESALNFIIFIILWIYTKKDRDWRVIVCLYAVMYSFIRFWLEFLRGDAIRGFIFIFSTSQFISVLIFIPCLYYLVYTRVNHNR